MTIRCEHACSGRRGIATVAFGLALAMLVPVTASGADPSPTSGQSAGDKWTGWWHLGGDHGTDTLLFDGGKMFEKDVQARSFAFGYRQTVSSGRDFGRGVDRRSTDTNNAYWPVSDSLRYGVDGKIGVRLFGRNVADDEAIFRPGEFWIYGGGFRVNGDGALSEVTGPNVRAEWRFDRVIEELPGSGLTLGGEYSNDNVRDDKWEFGLRLRVPFGGPTGRRRTPYTSL